MRLHCTPEEFLDAKGFTAPLALLIEASAWCDDYVGTPLAAHRHVEHKRMRPDRDGRLVWFPEHRPLISLESLTCGRTTYASPEISIRDERAVVVDIGSTSWTGGLQFGVSGELDTTWRYLAGYRKIPPEITTATVLRTLVLLGHDIDPGEFHGLLDLHRGGSR